MATVYHNVIDAGYEPHARVVGMKNTIIALVLISILGLGGYLYMNRAPEPPTPTPQAQETPTPSEPEATTAPIVEDKSHTILGQSVGGRNVVAYHYGEGEREVLFIGGIHGGYEWNTALLAYEVMEYLATAASSTPEGVKVTVIPVMNPDGLTKVVGTSSRFAAADIPASQDVQISGRSNGNGVDLNRNFDCDWKATGTWRKTEVSGGSEPFSEPESAAVKAYIEANTPEAVVVWFSAADGVYSSSCTGAVSATTKTLNQAYAKGSGYASHEKFDAYTVNGDITNWLARKGIAAISVLLSTHEDIEWAKNRNGVRAVLEHVAAQ